MTWVKRWLSGKMNDKWLLIYDNYDPESFSSSFAFDLERYLPEIRQGVTIITSTFRSLTYGIDPRGRISRFR
ncbi:hypothetical protein BO94DRAFT_97643 [Aspergillus sclerotioniger CBS 115572]|uniref:Uncharacterized protein n=1 Tax=Aspergillus sclerotioniger CBS 115572 TaxID=1450535 RepID=A0A317WKJ1_9EURO|nr:hypothetical protein BO94DRAFT_97643 [Aspergillus sclerotioniger CBS 115572]PWY85802.1 hypothetical protein BO94DRAFT_97643 [Aspergillus sclerotioniger CBS 115572]